MKYVVVLQNSRYSKKSDNMYLEVGTWQRYEPQPLQEQKPDNELAHLLEWNSHQYHVHVARFSIEFEVSKQIAKQS